MKDKKVLSKQEILNKNLDLEDLPVLDSFSLNKKDYSEGLRKSIIYTFIAVFIFFVPLTIGGETDITFGHIYNGAINFTGNLGLWVITLIVCLTGIASVYGIYITKKGALHEYFEGDSIFHPIMYLGGGVFALLYTLTATTSYQGPEIIIGSATGGTIIPIGVSVFWIILVSTFVMPFLINYGVIDFIGSLMEPLMRPIFKLPGRAAVNAIVSFLSSSSVGVLITNKLYRRGVYTEKEAVLVATGFSAVSIGFAYMVIKTSGLQDHFVQVYFISSIITLFTSGIIARIPPFNKKSDVYLNGKVQTEEDIKATKRSTSGESLVKIGVNRAVKKGFLAPPLLGEIKVSLKDSLEVIPKVVTTLCFIGTLALIIAENTPVFQWIGNLFVPLLNLLRVPNAIEIAPSFPVGIAEMFLPVLLIADKAATLHIGARFMVTAVSISQIIFFSETVVVMLSAKLPLKLWELVLVFIERTIIAIILSSIFMHLFFM
ncbi:MAG: nucleoside recognition domain-containing protein [Tissierellia bacterium]|nr:nucleoside recognition domain-containing protein [Tissierellia bacterium]MDD4726742.1 nucleoside recognition domain-containing protein [Tissierellia bacterium]